MKTILFSPVKDFYLMETSNGEKFWATKKQSDTLITLSQTRPGTIGTVHGYVPSTGYVEKPTVDIQGIFRISVTSLYKRRIEALNKIKFVDIADAMAANPKLANIPIGEAKQHFEDRKQKQIDRHTTTLEGDRSDSRRQGHDLAYIQVVDGIKVNLHTVKNKSSGLVERVLMDIDGEAHPTCESIMLGYLEIKRKTLVPGVKKVVNSGVPVLIGEAIENTLNKRSVTYRTLSLKEDNFNTIVIDRMEINSDDIENDPILEYAISLL